MNADERWAWYVTLPALALHLPVFAVCATSYWLTREAFGTALEFMETCERLVGVDREERDAA